MRYLAALTLAALSLAAISPDRHLERPRIAAKPPGHPVAQGIGPEAFYGPDTATVLAWGDGVAVAAYLDALEQTRLAEERAAAEAAKAREAAALTARQTITPARVGGTVSGDCAPVAAIIGWGIVNRESGGNPSAANPSGAYGCSQTLLSHYSGGVCSGLDPYTVAGQAACTQILYDRGGLNPWAQTR